MQSKNIIVELTEEFALLIIDFSEELRKFRYFSIADQIIRCGTSIGANVAEAQDAESRADFRHKLKIANKEANESRYWLRLCKKSNKLPDPSPEIIEKITSIRKILSTITRKIDKGY